MKALTKRDENVIRALAQACLARGGAVTEDADDAGVVERIDAWMARLSVSEIVKVRALFHMFEYYYAVHALSPFARFTAASLDQQAAYLSSWEQSELYARRLAFQGIRQIISIAYLEHKGVRERVGLSGDAAAMEHLAQLADAARLLSDRTAIKKVG